MLATQRILIALLCMLFVLAAAAHGLAAAGAPPAPVMAGIPAQSTPAPSRPLAPVVLKWTTKSEINTAGFNVFRAEDRAGPFTQVNPDLIPASNDAIAGGQYVYTDTASIAGVTYYYVLEDVEMNGRRTQHDPFMITAGSSTTGGSGTQLIVAAAMAAGAVVLLGALVWRMRRR
ncbi:MAG: hypothetical protein HZB53_13750 [Chloroflexi bacterium]|nr:hypothetical protein [Chloroflexota bacterium]